MSEQGGGGGGGAGDAPSGPENVRSISAGADRRVESTMHTLMGLSGYGFVGCVVIGIKPRNDGFSVIGSDHLDALQVIAALEVAKADMVALLRAGQARYST